MRERNEVRCEANPLVSVKVGDIMLDDGSDVLDGWGIEQGIVGSRDFLLVMGAREDLFPTESVPARRAVELDGWKIQGFIGPCAICHAVVGIDLQDILELGFRKPGRQNRSGLQVGKNLRQLHRGSQVEGFRTKTRTPDHAGSPPSTTPTLQ